MIRIIAHSAALLALKSYEVVEYVIYVVHSAVQTIVGS